MKTLALIIITLLSIYTLSGQSIADNQLTVEKNFHSDIYNVKPIKRNFLTEYDISQKSSIVRDSLISLNSVIPTSISVVIKPVAFKKHQEDDTYSGNVRINKGTISHWDGAADYQYAVDNYFHINLAASYKKWRQNNVLNKDFENIDVKVGMKYYVSDNIISTLTLKGYKNKYGKYGSTRLLSEFDNDNNSFSNFTIGSSVSTFNSGKKDFNLSLHTNYSTTTYNDGITKENLLLIKPKLSKQIGHKASLHLAGSGWVSFNDIIENLSHYNGYLKTNVNLDKWTFIIGATVNYNEYKTSLYPLIQSTFYLSNTNAIKLNIEEKIDYTGLDNLQSLNPYSLIHNPFVTYSKIHSIAYQLKLNLKTTFQAQLNYNISHNAVNFNGVDNKENITYDLIDIEQANISISASIDHTSYLNTTTQLAFNKYESLDLLYLRPAFTIRQTAMLTSTDKKLSFELEGIFNSGQNISVSNITGTNSTGIRKNINLKVDYSPFDNLTLNAQMNNALNDEYQVFDQYAVFGRNISGGLLFKF